MYSTDIVYEADKLGEAQITLCTDTLAKEILGWEAKLNIEDYINEYIYIKQ
jgi:hypothetical protein